ncbi:hypothetical protein RIF29_29721 [Crotalaria pallida]|uniref:Uncharacterized protein n=1 Tax=Crotalaria pallida TaxID=3830 RepID=A0AAN9EH68_CROPI
MPWTQPPYIAIFNGVNCPKQAQTPSHVRFLPLSSPKVTVLDRVGHHRVVGTDQCCSVVIQHINTSILVVWSVVPRFDNPQGYKHFVKSYHMVTDDSGIRVGAICKVGVISGLPAVWFHILDDECHIISFSVVVWSTKHGRGSGKGWLYSERWLMVMAKGYCLLYLVS